MNTSYKNNFIIRKLSSLPFILIFLVSIICLIGFVALWSAADGNSDPWASKQIRIFIIFLPISIIIALIDIRLIFKFSYLFYIIVLLLLIGVELFGSNAMGAKRWINLGLFKIQPSEPFKIVMVLSLARYFHQIKIQFLSKSSSLLLPVIAIALPVVLIIKQPDLGTGIIALMVAVVIFFAAGIEMKKFLMAGITVLISLPAIWVYLHDYQKKRILMFLNPEADALGAGYNIIQSKIAIGSGGIFGKGLVKGTQSHLSFLPEHQTDFIFASIAEEFGLIGCCVILLLYCAITILSLVISINCHSVYGKLLAIGITMIFTSHAIINIAMVMGIVPVVGVPLPLISYGGTMMASMFTGLGLLMNIHINKNERISYM